MRECLSIPRAVVVALLLSWPLSSAPAQGLSARARVDSTQYLLGDRIVVRVDLRHMPGLTIQPLVSDTIGGFAVLGQSGVQRSTDSTSRVEFVLAKYDSGDAVIPALPFLFFLPGDTASHVALSNQLRVTINTVPPDTSEDLKDVKPVLSLPLALEDLLLYGGILLVAAALGYFGYRYWKRRKRKGGSEEYVPPDRPAHAIAMEELGRLKAKKLWQQGQVKQYYSELTEILRRYFENRYRLPALEETTDEIMVGLRRLRPGPELLASTEAVLRRADLVKFAKHVPGVAEHEESLAAVYTFVDRTKIAEMTPAEASAPEEVKHVAS
ncbi:MAG: hypothetical protein IT282_08735 [Bacteroidetes bacterium]|nr:hypothetical protein [Bacteroidota bacterium]